MSTHFRMFAAYNAWANQRLYDAAGEIPEEQYNRDVGVFFGSLNGTLNHILVADRIWMHRFTGEGEHPKVLSQTLHENFESLRQAREAEDQRIIAWVESLDETMLASTISYTTITGPMQVTQRLASALAHFFNHQTHHRGQAHSALSILGHEPPSLDLLYFQRTDEGKQFQ